MSHGLLIAGGGLAAQRCCETLRALGHDGAITVVGEERHAPYDRPPLSKTLGGPAAPARFRDDAWYAEHGLALRLGVVARRLDAGRRLLELADGERLRYDDLLIATGSRPVELPILGGRPGVQVLRTFEDSCSLAATLRPDARLAIVGAGLIGLEVASTAQGLGASVTVLEAAGAPVERVLGPRVGALLGRRHRASGVDLRLGVGVTGAHGEDAVEALALADGTTVPCDRAIVAVGVRPAAAWLAGSGLDPRGVAIDAGARTALPHVYAAGDVTGAGHWEAAARQGAAAARSLLGLAPLPPAPPSFWSDQLGLRLHGVGDPTAADRVTVLEDAAGPGFEAVYERRGRCVAVVLAGRPPTALRAARRAVAETFSATTDQRSAA